MISIQCFVFGPFQENTYILYDETKQAVIIDPGCYDEAERQKLADFILKNNLIPVKLINTHCHLDHVFGNGFVAKKYNLQLETHQNEVMVLDSYMGVAIMYNLSAQPSPQPSVFLTEADVIQFGNSSLSILFTPGHSPGSLTFYSSSQNFIIAGDVLFYGSIGRTDLPGGHHQTLIESIQSQLLTLTDLTEVYSGHGPSTTIGFERKHNPFLT